MNKIEKEAKAAKKQICDLADDLYEAAMSGQHYRREVDRLLKREDELRAKLSIVREVRDDAVRRCDELESERRALREGEKS